MSSSTLRAACLAAAALFAVACAPMDDDGVGTGGDSIIGGTNTFARPEVGQLAANGRGCTATLVGSHVVITAAHCIHENWNVGTFPLTGRLDGTFTVQTDATTSHAYRLSQYRSFGHATGDDDVSIVQLAEDVPSTIAAPTSISVHGFRRGDALTIYGYGCDHLDPTTGGGVKRRISTRAGDGTPGTTNLCPGDSGGPVFASDGIVRINSAIRTNDTNGNGVGDVNTGDVFANPLARRDEVVTQIQTFQNATPVDCQRITSLAACNAAQCAWYACSNSCRNPGTDISIACPSECRTRSTIDRCTAAPGCAWYACSNSCWGRGTPVSTACPPVDCRAQAGIDRCVATAGCAWYACSNSCWASGTPVSTACPSGGAGASTPTSTPDWDCARSSYRGSQYWTCVDGTLHRCAGGVPSSLRCSAGCATRPLGVDDVCN